MEAPLSHNSPRSLARRIAVVLAVLLLVLVLVSGGIGWYFSSQAIAVDRLTEYDNLVVSQNGDTVRLRASDDSKRAGAFAIASENGTRAVVGEIVSIDSDTVNRRFVSPPTQPFAADTAVEWDDEVWLGDPAVTRDLAFRSVSFPSELGPMPAWLVPGRSSTWVITVHGRGGSREEGLRIAPVLREMGFPTLMISYRNDVGAPQHPDGHDHFGDVEWRDIDAAMQYAKAQGAANVILYGWSMGGAMVMATLNRSADAGFVRAVVLDAPVMDWRSTLDHAGSERKLPLYQTRIAEQIASWRIGFDFDDFDQRRFASSLKVPVLQFVPLDDNTVPPKPTLEFGRMRPDLVRTVTTPAADHTESWNVDPATYERSVREFLTPFAA